MSGTDELEELNRNIRKTIEDNRKFLERIMDEEFEPEEEDGTEEVFEEL